MAKDKKSFVLYADLIHTVRKLPKAKAGELFLTILQYVNDENPTVKDVVVDVAFEPIKRQLKRDLMAYEEIKEKRKAYGKKGGEKSGEARSKTKQNEANASNDEAKRSNTQANEAVTVTVNDTVTVNVNEINSVYAPSSNLERFKQSATDQQLMAKYAGGIGKILTQSRVVELSESHDIAHAMKHKNSTYAKWCEYFRYFLRDHKEPFKLPDQPKYESVPSYHKRLNP